MNHTTKVVVFLSVVIATSVILWGIRGIPSIFSAWPDRS